jgi:hypothetical protein
MRTKTINLYQFNELSDEAKEKAINKWREDEYSNTPWFIEEATESFKMFCSIFSVKWQNLDYEEPYRNDYSINLDDNILELSGQRLATYIWNHYKDDIFHGKYYGELVDTFKDGTKIPISKEHPIGKRHVKRYSHVFMSSVAVMTGVCYDDDLLNPIYEFLNKPKENVNFEILINDCIYSLCGSVSDEIEYQMSDEAITETILANEYEFYKDGTMA